jgi:hypothetical protein
VFVKTRNLVISSLAVVLGLAGCSVGKGVGAASGNLFEYGCSKDGDYCSSPGVCGTEANPVPYDLHPGFFAGEPIDDLREYSAGSAIMSNRLIIRLKRSDIQFEHDDVLTFDIATSYEVARCVRGRVDATTGLNDWDETNCYRASDTGPGRMRVQFDSPVHAALTINKTCPNELLAKSVYGNLVASAVSAPVPLNYVTTPNLEITDGGWASWVEFEEFGGAAQVDKLPQARDPVSAKFRIEFGQRINASAFVLTLVDDKVVYAAINNLPRPTANTGGSLGGDPTTGRFDFDLERGQGAQFFP